MIRHKYHRLGRLPVMLRATIVGLLLGEAIAFSTVVVRSIQLYLSSSDLSSLVLLATIFSLIILATYIFFRDTVSIFILILRSLRLDLLLMAVLGFLTSTLGGGIGTSAYQKLVFLASPQQLIVLVSIPVCLAAMIVIRNLFAIGQNKKQIRSSFFVSDEELRHSIDDILKTKVRAKNFAMRVLNGGSSDSLVFGIDAPWGIGKSTFVNFCVEEWTSEDTKPIVYKFNPLRYESRSGLLEKFVDGLISHIQEEMFIPELTANLSKYSRLIRTSGLSVVGLKLETFLPHSSIEDALKVIEETLSSAGKKIIVIVDDLDRLPFPQVEDILYTIKVSFRLPNISYVLCYDTENITIDGSGESEKAKIREFLEKFVNVKLSLFIEANALADFVSVNLEKAIANNEQIDPFVLGKIRETLGAVEDICRNSRKFHLYQGLLGDVRKIKRIINAVILFGIEQTDFEGTDFNKRDLLHLLLIYINYPNVFRKIYNTETGGRRGFFSLIHSSELPRQEGVRHEHEPTYCNSKEFSQYVSKQPSDLQFVLNELFLEPPIRELAESDSDDQKVSTSSACFNGAYGSGRNLEQYLHLIVSQAQPPKRSQHKPHSNNRDAIKNGADPKEIFADEIYSTEMGEASQEMLWRLLVNSAHNLGPQSGRNVIEYLLAKIEDYSLLQIETEKFKVGLRDDCGYFLVKLLDDCGWLKEDKSRRNNTPENIAEIAEWIFGEASHVGGGVLDILGSPDRGVLGIFDLMSFRLSCSADRGGNTFNLSRSLSFHSDPNAPTQGLVSLIAIAEMREISQKVFQIFKEQYIAPRRNVLAEVEQLTLADLSGKVHSSIQSAIESGLIISEDVEHEELRTKSRMKAFVVYQLTNNFVSSGVGCGYYDPEGAIDKHGIYNEMNAYLFDICFNPELDKANTEHFLDYLVLNFSWDSQVDEPDDAYQPNIDALAKVLNKDRLRSYWEEHRNAILASDYETRQKRVCTSNYVKTYAAALPRLYKVLDAFVSPDHAPNPSTTEDT